MSIEFIYVAPIYFMFHVYCDHRILWYKIYTHHFIIYVSALYTHTYIIYPQTRIYLHTHHTCAYLHTYTQKQFSHLKGYPSQAKKIQRRTVFLDKQTYCNERTSQDLKQLLGKKDSHRKFILNRCSLVACMEDHQTFHIYLYTPFIQEHYRLKTENKNDWKWIIIHFKFGIVKIVPTVTLHAFQ